MLQTARLSLREWRAEDMAPFTAMNADPAVMEHFPILLSAAESAASMERAQAHIIRHGFGFWAVEAPGVASFIGFVGIAHVAFDAPFTPAVEIGWRLARAYWGQGYAAEAARAAVADGFGRLGLREIVSFTVPGNWRSRRVMAQLGMTHDAADDFDRPRLPATSPLRRHVLYRLRRGDRADARPSTARAPLG
jgi:ribosomal-protein-alanine N-acetyltransferase